MSDYLMVVKLLSLSTIWLLLVKLDSSLPEIPVPETVLNTPDFESSSTCGVEAPAETPVLPSDIANEPLSPPLSENEALPVTINEGTSKSTPFIRTRPYNLRSREV